MAALRDTLSLAARDFALALHRFTRLQPKAPLAASPASETDRLRSSARHLPGVGWVVGMLACLVFALVSLALRGNPWAPAVAAVFSTIASVLVTGAQHESAWARAAERLEVRSPGTSSHGMLALVLVLAAKTTLLAALASASEAGVMAALFAGHVLSRFAPLLAVSWADDAERVDRRSLAVAGAWSAPPLLLMLAAGQLPFLVLPLLVAALACFVLQRFARKVLGGPAEDAWGAVQQIAEVAFYFGAAIAAG